MALAARDPGVPRSCPDTVRHFQNAVQGDPEFMIRSYRGQLPQIPASCYIDLSAQDRALILEYAQNYLDYTEFYLKGMGVDSHITGAELI